MTESKEEAIFEKTREILAKYELTGISKNELAQQIQHYGIASRMTFYTHFDEMTNPNGANIIRKVTPKGKINALCFPTPSNLALVQLKHKFKSVEALLNHIEKNSIGDCFIPLPTFEDFPKVTNDLEPDNDYAYTATPRYFELLFPKKDLNKKATHIITIHAHNARKEFLEKLPLFLISYINSPKMKLANQIKKECMKIITPIILRSFKIFNNDYSGSIYVSKKTREIIQDTMPQNSMVLIKLVKAPVMLYLEVEFLKILGRYYYTTSKQFAKEMYFDSCNEQKLISKMITDFYYVHDSQKISEDELDEHDIKSIVVTNAHNSLIRNKEHTLKIEYGFNPDSLALKLAKTFAVGKYDDDPMHIRKYYLELFSKLHLFEHNEQQVLDYVLNQEESLLSSHSSSKS